MVLLASLSAAALLLTRGEEMALRGRERPPTYSCDAAPDDRGIRADAQVNADGTVRGASVHWSIGSDFHGPTLSGLRLLDGINLTPAPESYFVGYFDRRYRGGQRLSLEIQTSDGTVVMQSPRLRTNRHGQINQPVAISAWQAIQRESAVIIVVRGTDGTEIDRQLVSHEEIVARLAQRDAATAQLQAMARDFRNACESSADVIVVT